MERRALKTLIPKNVEFFNDREEFEQLTGEQPPPFDASLPPKHWRVNLTMTGPYAYDSIDRQTGKYFGTSVGGDETKTVNLQGRYYYPDHNVKPTEAQTENGHRVGAGQLCLESQAAALAEELSPIGATSGPHESKHMGNSRIIYPVDENRRYWFVIHSGRVLNCGLLWSARNRLGVGYPGRWVSSDPDPIFEAGMPVTKNDLPPVAVPYRDLVDDERLVRDSMGNLVVEVGEADEAGATADALARLEVKLDQLISIVLARG